MARVLELVLGLLGGVAFVAAFTLVPGRLDWIRGWATLGLIGLGQTVMTVLVRRRDPEVLRRRVWVGEGTKRWDLFWLAGFGVLTLGIFVVAGLDAGRHGWSTMSWWAWSVGAPLYLGFSAGVGWCMVVNTHFEKTVRIQTDRDHRVIDTGPYALVRHPGYVCASLGIYLPLPLLLGSWWAFVPTGLAVAWLVVRTALEDATLRRELPGYEEYAARVRWRLVPGVW
jgi:protein-S-isoprenylcysteine O-methyltransferase Ste14